MIPRQTTPPPVTGFSFSPGGLLLPYHVGVMEALVYNGQVQSDTPIAGSSAGSIAVAAHACGASGPQILDITSQIADECRTLGGARGRLLPLLRKALDDVITEHAFEQFQSRPGTVAIAYQEVFPFYRSQHQTSFEDVQDLKTAICHSSTFPFFTTNWPVAMCTARGGIPRLVTDGFFAVPRTRFGCPDLELAGIEVDREVLISVFPQDIIGLDAVLPNNCISPSLSEDDDDADESSSSSSNQSTIMRNLLRLATQPATSKEYHAVYESGWKDAERWCRNYSDDDGTAFSREEQADMLSGSDDEFLL